MSVIIRALLIFFSCLFFNSDYVEASIFESLVIPGKVIQGHAKYEDDCEKCHESFSKKSQRRLCLDCHKEVAKDMKKKAGFHGRNADIREVECKQCHSDHLGRGADIVQFNKSLFDHSQTNFSLRGGHIKLRCESCHKKKDAYRKAPVSCYLCHKSEDVHKEKFGKDCAKCHKEDNWLSMKFNHDKTDYPLTGKHKKITCALCHPNERYKDIPQKCINCHAINDIHKGDYGKKCQDCHSTKSWKSYDFDHDKKTKYKLRGKHKKARCETCHKQDYKKKLKTECYACHKKQDTHKELLGKKCGDCHGESAWRKHRFKHEKFKKTQCYDCHKHDDVHKGRYGQKCAECHLVKDWGDYKYDHDGKTKFPLLGKHKKVSCKACHKGEAKKEKDKTQCLKCHAKDDVHDGKEGKECQQCHNEKDWRETITFDHDMSRFPIIGLHATTPCEECHLSARYKDASRECNDCHERDDVHKRRLGPSCEQCHNPNSWKFWQFDHDKQTDYKLKGAHKKINCQACHKAAVKKQIELSASCNYCHRGDDIHEGGFGRQCERCHNDVDFKEVTLQ